MAASEEVRNPFHVLHRRPRRNNADTIHTHQLQLVNVVYENEKKKPQSLYRRSLSRRHSMIEDSDCSVLSGAITSSQSHNKHSSLTKPIKMQTSRLSVFLQQHKDPTNPPPAVIQYPKTAPCTLYTFATPFSQGSPNMRRTRNDDEYYGGFGRSASVRRSGREGRSGQLQQSYQPPQQHGYQTTAQQDNKNNYQQESKFCYHHPESKPAYQQESSSRSTFQQDNSSSKSIYQQDSSKSTYQQDNFRPTYHQDNSKSTYQPDNRPSYQQDTITSVRRSKERSQTHTDSPSRFRRTPSSRATARPTVRSQLATNRPVSANTKQSPVRHHKDTGHTHHCALSRTPSCKSSVGEQQQQQQQLHQASKRETVGSSQLSRHGSVRVPSSSYSRQDSGLLRSFSLRRKGPEDFLHTSSMPCLADPVLRTGAGPLNTFGKDKNSNYFSSSGRSTAEQVKHQQESPASPSLVMNSLAYQVLPEQVTFQRGRSRYKEQQQRPDWNHTPLAQTGSYGSTGSTSYSSSSASSSLSLHSPPSPVQTRKRPLTDDSDGHLAYLPGDFVSDRYEVLSTLGEGTFGKVVKVKDHENDEFVAMKIIKNIHKYREAAKLEINVLQKLNTKDPSGKHLCVRMFDSFNYFGHMCLTFEILGESVFDFLKGNGYVGYPLDQVRHIAYQLSYAVKFLHENHLTHTDLKPENILFVTGDWYSEYCPLSKKTIRRMRDTRVKLIDFGSATFDWEHHSSVVSTRHYRPPEVILELGWTHPCDIWSTGCIIFELYQGHTLFQTHDNLEHLAMMSRILGELPGHIVRRSRSSMFTQGRLAWDWSQPGARYANQHCRPLHQYRRHDRSSQLGQEESYMLDLVARMLEYDPERRILLKDALKHPFFDSLSVYQKLEEVSKHILRLQI